MSAQLIDLAAARARFARRGAAQRREERQEGEETEGAFGWRWCERELEHWPSAWRRTLNTWWLNIKFNPNWESDQVHSGAGLLESRRLWRVWCAKHVPDLVQRELTVALLELRVCARKKCRGRKLVQRAAIARRRLRLERAQSDLLWLLFSYNLRRVPREVLRGTRSEAQVVA